MQLLLLSTLSKKYAGLKHLLDSIFKRKMILLLNLHLGFDLALDVPMGCLYFFWLKSCLLIPDIYNRWNLGSRYQHHYEKFRNDMQLNIWIFIGCCNSKQKMCLMSHWNTTRLPWSSSSAGRAIKHKQLCWGVPMVLWRKKWWVMFNLCR